MSTLGILIVLLVVVLAIALVTYLLRGRETTSDGTKGVPPILKGTIVDSTGQETVPGLDNSEGFLTSEEVKK